MASQYPPLKNAAYTFDISVWSQANSTTLQSSPTIAAGDFKHSGDGGALANFTNLPTATGTQITIVLTAAEMNYDRVFLYWQDAAGAEWISGFTQLMTSARLINDLAFPTTTGRSIDVTATGAVGIDWANVENPTTALNLSATNFDVDQVVASVSGAVGSVTGAVGSVTGNVGGNVTGSIGTLAAAALVQVNAEVVDCLNVDTYAEPASVPAATASLAAKLGWVACVSRNKITQTTTTETLRNNADSGTIATATVSDVAGTTTRTAWT